ASARAAAAVLFPEPSPPSSTMNAGVMSYWQRKLGWPSNPKSKIQNPKCPSLSPQRKDPHAPLRLLAGALGIEVVARGDLVLDAPYITVRRRQLDRAALLHDARNRVLRLAKDLDHRVATRTVAHTIGIRPELQQHLFELIRGVRFDDVDRDGALFRFTQGRRLAAIVGAHRHHNVGLPHVVDHVHADARGAHRLFEPLLRNAEGEELDGWPFASGGGRGAHERGCGCALLSRVAGVISPRPLITDMATATAALAQLPGRAHMVALGDQRGGPLIALFVFHDLDAPARGK